MENKKTISLKGKKLLYIAFFILAAVIIAFVLFKYPKQGVADQGDFDRVMITSGLTLLDSDKNNPDFVRFYNYIVTDYKIVPGIIYEIPAVIGSSTGYFIVLISAICKMFGSYVFKTQYLAVGLALVYVSSLALILKSLNIKSKIKFALLSVGVLFVFLDGNYLIWFNSLYGEATMISTCTLFIATVLNYINNKYVKKDSNKLLRNISYILVAAFLFFTSKMQAITTMPFVGILIGKILWDNRKEFRKKTLIILCVIFCSILAHPIVLNKINGNISKDTQYNSVFYGVLNGSKTPEQDLVDMGLNPDMASEAGKHSYLEASEYVKYVPRTEITEREFYSKMSNGKLAKFYLTHPTRLIDGMKYTASKAYITSSSLGKTYRDVSEEPIRELNRFTNWSNFRETKLPTSLWFIIATYILMFGVSLIKFIKIKEDKAFRYKIMVLWCVMLMGAIQFPMPFIGNGRADTAKQLFLFNFIFDIMIGTSVAYIFSKVMKIFTRK